MSEELESIPPNVAARPEPIPEPSRGDHPLRGAAQDVRIKRISVAMALLTSVCAILTAITTWLPQGVFVPLSTPTAAAPAAEIQALQNRVNEVSSRLEELEAALASAPAVPPNTALSAQLGAVRLDLDSVDDRLTAIEGVILQDPDGALELARLAMELGTLEERQATRTDAIEREVARIYDFNKWFIVLMLTMAATLVAVAVSMYSGRRAAQ